MVAIVLLASLGLAIHGCTGETPSFTKITVTYPGATPQLVEVQVAIPVEYALAGTPRLREVVSISSRGKAEFYIIWDSRYDSRDLNDRLAVIAKDLPRSTGTPVVEPVTETPAATPETALAPMVLVVPDNLTLELHELDQQDVWKAAMSVFCETDNAQEQLTRLAQVRINTDSADVPLTDVATIEIVEHPLRVVHRNGQRVE
jgi:multidrug efflux pump subunit AcrB